MAVEAWNLMGGVIDWSALPILCEMFGVTDPETFIRRLCLIRDQQIKVAHG